MRLCLYILSALFLIESAQGQPETNQPPPKPSKPVATNEVSALIVKPGFKVELVATAPLVTAPVAMTFDENGRLFVAEMRESGPHLGRIRMLEDTEGDGTFSTGTVYADDVPWPSALACYDGGLFVISAPNLLYLKDTKGQGNADVRRTVFSDFPGGNPPSPLSLPNNLNWGLDNRIHGAGGAPRMDSSQGEPAQSSLNNCDFAIEPRTLTFSLEAGPSQSGLSFDSRGRRFTMDFGRPLRIAVLEQRYSSRNPYVPMPPGMADVLSPVTAVFKATRAKPGQPVPISATWLTNARGGVVYRGMAFPTNYFNNVFIPDPEAHVIHRAVLLENGLVPAAGRALEDRNSEFLISTDPLFQPVQVVNAPDGTLYIADFHGGGENGRIYRVVPQAFKQPKPPRMRRASTAELVAAIGLLNGWHSDTAARLLYERRDPTAGPLLRDMLRARSSLVRLHALHTLDGAGLLREEQILSALADPDGTIREHALQLSEKLVKDGKISDALWERFKGLATDPSLHVRYQLALTLGEVQRADRAEVLFSVLNSAPTNQWIQAAILSSLTDNAAPMLIRCVGDIQFRATPAGAEFVHQLALMIGCRGRLDDVTAALSYLAGAKLGERAIAYKLIYWIGDGLERTRSSLVLVDPQNRLLPFYQQALTDALDSNFGEVVQVPAMEVLGVSSFVYDDVTDWISLAFGSGQSEAVQVAAIDTLTRLDDVRVATNLLARWQLLPQTVRSAGLSALLGRPFRIPVVLSALENGVIAATDFPPVNMNLLRTFPDESISGRALKVFGAVGLERPEVMKQFQPALKLLGVAEHGRGVFLGRCAACHRLGNEGSDFGPDLTAARLGGREKILSALLQPNLDVNPDYATSVVETRDGRSLVGTLASASPLTITLRQLGKGHEVWPRLNVQEIRTETWSLMPEGLEQGLSQQDMADLLAYIMTGPQIEPGTKILRPRTAAMKQ